MDMTGIVKYKNSGVQTDTETELHPASIEYCNTACHSTLIARLMDMEMRLTECRRSIRLWRIVSAFVGLICIL